MLLDSIILEVAIGLVFIYLLLSLVCTAAGEYVSRVLALRSKILDEGIRNLLNDEGKNGVASKFYEHPLITGISRQGFLDKILSRKGNPSYIPARMFAMVLLDVITQQQKPQTVPQLKLEIVSSTIIDQKTKDGLLLIIDNADSISTARSNIEEWFNDSMDRVTGWYTRNVQTVILVLALIISVGANADTIMIANDIATDSALRASLVEAASDIAVNSTPSGNEAVQQLQLFPLGWSEFPIGTHAWVTKIFGLLITTFAISLGAPFWFDLLKNVVNLRGTGKPPK